jgi:predicted permease
MAAGLALGISGIAMAYAIPWVPGLRRHIDAREHAASAQVAFRFNSFIGLALAERLAGAQGLLLIAVLIGVCVPLFNVGAVWPMARHAGSGLVAALVRNPLIIATALGLASNLSGLHVPVWVSPTLDRIGAASIALGLMASGAGMQLAMLARSKALTVSVLAIRHLLLPLVALGLSILLHLDAAQALVLLVFSALPTASSCFVLASRMGYNGGYVAGLVTLSTLLGMASLPFALGLVRH